MEVNIIRLFLLLFLTFASVYSQEVIDINSLKDNYSGRNDQIYQVNFPDYGQSPEYIHFYIIPSLGRPAALFSFTDASCTDSRTQMSFHPYDDLNFYIKKDEIKFGKSGYLCMKCIKDDNCNYNIKVKKEDMANIEFGTHFRYYVNAGNTLMKFQFKAKRDIQTGTQLQMWVKGEKITATDIYPIKMRDVEFDHGKTFYGKYDSTSTYILTVVAEEGDFISIGSYFVQDGVSMENLRINDIETIGNLNRGIGEICYNIQQIEIVGEKKYFYFDGIIFKNKLKFYFKTKDSSQIFPFDIYDGILNRVMTDDQIKQSQMVCFSYVDQTEKREEIVFSFSFIHYASNVYGQLIHPPQIPGYIYRHRLISGEVALFQGMITNKEATEINYNMKSLIGFSDMRFYKCNTFPKCTYSESSQDEDPNHTTRMTVKSFYLKDEQKITTISAFQPLLVVKCDSGVDIESFNACRFETSIFTNKDRLILEENDAYSQYLLEYESDLYSIDFMTEDEKDIIYLDVIIFSGDVNLIMESNIKANKYYLANKIFYSIHIKESTLRKKMINFKVTAYKKSFYTIQYQMVKRGEERSLVNTIESGTSYLESVSIGETGNFTKYIEVQNFKQHQKCTFLVNFYSLNCKFFVFRMHDETEVQQVRMIDNYGQDIITPEQEYYNNITYKYRLLVEEVDITKYNKQNCMIYVSGFEFSNSARKIEGAISISENVPQFYNFTREYPSIVYVFHLADRNNIVIINFNLIDKARFSVKVRVGYNEEKSRTMTIIRNFQWALDKNLLKECEEDEVCQIYIEMSLDDEKDFKRVETTVYQVNGAPMYIQKNAMTQDILINTERKYYYFDIGKEEYGDIKIDYRRGGGSIYASIVNKTGEIERFNADWRGMYDFPLNVYESLRYETYLRKIVISPVDTEQCENGCYVLISVESTTNEQLTPDKNVTISKISITPRITPNEIKDFSDIPSVRIQVNEFVIGNIYQTDKEIYEFYTVSLPYDSDILTIDWQADGCYLYLRFDEEKPNLKDKKYDFEFIDLGVKTVHKLEKREIQRKLQERQISIDSLKYLYLTIGIYTSKIDTVFTSMYAFRISMPLSGSSSSDFQTRLASNILHVRSDQKVQCKPERDNNDYQCLFAIIFDRGDIGKSLLAYPKAENENVQVKFYANLVNSYVIETNNISRIIHLMPKENATYSSNNGSKYIYVNKIERVRTLLIRTVTSSDVNIELLSTIMGNETYITPNPSTAQVFGINLQEGQKAIKFSFETTQNLLINIAGISGEGYFKWDEELDSNRTYYMYGFEDRLTLTSFTSKDEYKLTTLTASGVDFPFTESESKAFVFYMTYYPRSDNFNIDMVKEGRSTEFNYRELKFPLNYYSTITGSDFIGVSFNFYNLYAKVQSVITSDKPILKIWGKIVDSETIVQSRMMSIALINSTDAINGSFDGVFGSLILHKSDIEKYKIDNPENRRFYFSVELNKEIALDLNAASIEVSVLKNMQSGDYSPEHVYLNGNLTNDHPEFRYKIKVQPNNTYIAFEFAANSKLVQYAFGPYENAEQNKNYNPEELEKVKRNGKYVISFKLSEDILKGNSPLYFNVFLTKGASKSEKLGNYLFKYMTSKIKNYFDYFIIENDVVKYEIYQQKEGDVQSYKLTFTPTRFPETNYYVKLVYKNTVIDGEEKDTIAISESPGKYAEIDNPDNDHDKNVVLTVEGVSQPIAYIKVLAKMKLDSLNEYVLYQPLPVGDADDEPHGTTEKINETEALQSLTYDKEKRQIIGIAQKAKKIQKYELTFLNEEDKPNYIRVQAESANNITQVLYFSPTDPNGRENRLQLGQESFGRNVTMWIKKEQFSQIGSKLYTTVECKEESCAYRLIFSGFNSVQFEESAFVYNYYVSEHNKQMLFRIKNDFKIYEMFGEVLTLYAGGNKFVNLTIKDCYNESCNPTSFIGAAAITTDLPKHNYIEVLVEGEVGDYVSIGSKVTFKQGLSFTNELTPNYYPLMGYLKKGVLDRECYHLGPSSLDSTKIYYISIIFYNEQGGVYFLDENLQPLEATRQIVTNGYYSYTYMPPSEDRYLCIYIPEDNDKYTFSNFTYTIQLTEPKEMKEKGLYNIFAPQQSGFIYPRITPAGTVVFFNSIYDTISGTETIFNMFSVSGLPKMYMYHCKNYPLCNIDYDKINTAEGVIKINEINRMNTWHYNSTLNSTPISPEQYVMLIKCEDLQEYSSEFCEFQTSIYGSNDTIFLIENQPFSQYIIKNEIEGFFIDFSRRKNVKRIFVDTLVISGDVNFEFYDYYGKEEIAAHKYYVGNKIFYSIAIDPQISIPILSIIMKARLNSYYIIDYRIVTSEEEQLVNTVYSDANHLIPIPLLSEYNVKEISIENKNLLKNSYYLVSFQALNCKFNVKQKLTEEEYEDIPSYGRFAQKLFRNTEEELELKTHIFRIETTENDVTHYDTNFCMVYASGLEITSNPQEERDLLLGEAIPQKVKFDETLKKIRYVYPLMNNTKNVAVDLKINSHALFNLTIFVNGEVQQSQLFSRDIVYFLDRDMVKGKCAENTICHIVLGIEFKESYDKGVFPILETMIRQTRNVPYYISKDVAHRDFVSGDVKLYLYTDIGKGEQGYITANFDRGSGNLYASIVPIGEVSNNTTPDWRNYTFPKDYTQSIKYNYNEKKILFDNFDTAKCEKGCYILITLQNSVISSYTDEARLYHLTLTIHVDKVGEDYVTGRSIEIAPEQYIIGSFNDFDRLTEKKMYDYYEITIPYDVDFIEFDWQATTPRLIINKGTTKPTIDQADFKFGITRGDTILKLNKTAISKESLANQVLTIGIYGEDIESIYGTKYSFRVHLYRSLNIHKISQDQKTLCVPELINGKLSCLFMITYEFLQFFNDVMIFAKSQSISANVYMYGKFVNKTEYERQKDDDLRKLIPNEGNTDFNKNEKRDFIFTSFGEDHMNLFINVITNEQKIIEFMSSFKTFDKILSPNPTGCQVFSMSENEESIVLHIPTTKGLFINFISIHGSGRIQLFNDIETSYNIRGRDDRLSFAIPQSEEGATVFTVVNLNYQKTNTLTQKGNEYPGFAFYIEYNLRGYDNVNFDELSFGKTSEISYFFSGFPFYYYAKLDKFDANLYAFFTFHDLDYKKTDDMKREIRTSEFQIESTLVEQKKIYPAILDYQKIPQPHQLITYDFYDPAIFTGNVNYLKAVYGDIIPDKDFPTFFFSIKQTNNGTDRITYNRIRLEMTLSKENDDSITTEKMYQYGLLFDPEQINFYKLKVDGTEGFMRIEMSPGTEYIDIAISDKCNATKNFTTFIEQRWSNGKYIMTFNKPKKDFIYLNVFIKRGSSNEVLMLLNSYTFKYINSPKREDFKDYTTVNGDTAIKITSEKTKRGDRISYVGVNFSPIKLPKESNTSVIYSLKVVENLVNEVKGEIYDSIALKYYEGIVKYENKEKSADSVTIMVNNVDNGYHYAQVIAQIREGSIIEYFSYKPYYNPETKHKPVPPGPPEPESNSAETKTSEDNDTTVIIIVVVISVVLLIAIIVLVVIITIFNKKNKTLLDDVIKTSFMDSDNNRPTNNSEDRKEEENRESLVDPINELE